MFFLRNPSCYADFYLRMGTINSATNLVTPETETHQRKTPALAVFGAETSEAYHSVFRFAVHA